MEKYKKCQKIFWKIVILSRFRRGTCTFDGPRSWEMYKEKRMQNMVQIGAIYVGFKAEIL